MIETRSPAPRPAYRLIPSQFPPIGLFDTVSTAADLEAVMELAGWTNDRLVADRIDRLPQSEWVYGRPNSSIVMAAFLHVAPGGMRFNRPDLGAWYAAASLTTAIVEVAHHLRRETIAMKKPNMSRTYRTYLARMEGRYLDLSAQTAYANDLLDPESHMAAQAFGEAARARGEDGILYRSVRHVRGLNIAGYRPSQILDVTQADHYEIAIKAGSPSILVKRLTA